MKKLGFCFLITDHLYNQEFWKEYFSKISDVDYEVYIHYKSKPNIILSKYKFVDPIPTRWGDISLVRATLKLFQEASNDNCDLFFLLSGDTLPLVSFDKLQEIDKSIFSIQPLYWGKEHRIRNHELLSPILKNKIYYNEWLKQNMFFGITNSDYKIISQNNLTPHFEKLLIPDEYYFVNLFTLYNLEFINGKFIFVDPQELRTQACGSSIPNYIFEKYEKVINQYYFCRKIEDFSRVKYFYSLL